MTFHEFIETYQIKLNIDQLEAVQAVDGAVLLLAVPGSGKTTVLVQRIVFLVKYGNAYYSDYVPHDLTQETVKRLEEAAY